MKFKNFEYYALMAIGGLFLGHAIKDDISSYLMGFAALVVVVFAEVRIFKSELDKLKGKEND